MRQVGLVYLRPLVSVHPRVPAGVVLDPYALAWRLTLMCQRHLPPRPGPMPGNV
jgi:hypothetical protein